MFDNSSGIEIYVKGVHTSKLNLYERTFVTSSGNSVLVKFNKLTSSTTNFCMN